MRARSIRRILFPAFLGLILLGGRAPGGQTPSLASPPTLFGPFVGNELAGEVMAADREKQTLLVRVLEQGKPPRDVALTLDGLAVLKKLRTPISGGELTPGHLVKVRYRDHAGRLLAYRIEVTGKAVHQPMP